MKQAMQILATALFLTVGVVLAFRMLIYLVNYDNPAPIENYNYVEMEALITSGQATPSKDSITIECKVGETKLPVTTYKDKVYYPTFTDSNTIEYVMVR